MNLQNQTTPKGHAVSADQVSRRSLSLRTAIRVGQEEEMVYTPPPAPAPEQLVLVPRSTIIQLLNR
jgi:hypothetical protein